MLKLLIIPIAYLSIAYAQSNPPYFNRFQRAAEVPNFQQNYEYIRFFPVVNPYQINRLTQSQIDPRQFQWMNSNMDYNNPMAQYIQQLTMQRLAEEQRKMAQVMAQAMAQNRGGQIDPNAHYRIQFFYQKTEYHLKPDVFRRLFPSANIPNTTQKNSNTQTQPRARTFVNSQANSFSSTHQPIAAESSSGSRHFSSGYGYFGRNYGGNRPQPSLPHPAPAALPPLPLPTASFDRTPAPRPIIPERNINIFTAGRRVNGNGNGNRSGGTPLPSISRPRFGSTGGRFGAGALSTGTGRNTGITRISPGSSGNANKVQPGSSVKRPLNPGETDVNFAKIGTTTHTPEPTTEKWIPAMSGFPEFRRLRARVMGIATYSGLNSPIKPSLESMDENDDAASWEKLDGMSKHEDSIDREYADAQKAMMEEQIEHQLPGSSESFHPSITVTANPSNPSDSPPKVNHVQFGLRAPPISQKYQSTNEKSRQ